MNRQLRGLMEFVVSEKRKASEFIGEFEILGREAEGSTDFFVANETIRFAHEVEGLVRGIMIDEALGYCKRDLLASVSSGIEVENES